MKTRASRWKALRSCATGRAQRRTRGYILPAAVVVLFVLTVAGMALLDMGRGEAIQVMKETRYLKALNLAEACIERALWKMADEPGWTQGWTNAALGGGTYSATIEPLGGNWYTITSTGTVGGIDKTLTLRAKVSGGLWPPPFNDYALFWANPTSSQNTLQLANNASVVGSVFCYGGIEVRNSATVTNGEVYATGSVSGGGTYTVGDVPDPPPDRLQFDTSYYDALIAQAAARPKGDWNLSNNKQYSLGGQTLLINGEVTVSNNSTVTGPGKIVATGDIEFQNNSAIRGGVDLISGARLYLYNSSQIETYGNVLFARTSITLENNCATSGGSMFVYTPGSLSMSNNGAFHGIFWGGVVGLKNNAGVVGSVYADQLDGNKIWNNVTIQHAEPDFQPPPGVPPGEPITVTIGAWAEQEAVGL